MAVAKADQSYAVPPIIEAIVQIRFAEAVSQSVLRKAQRRLRKGYDNELSQKVVAGKLDISAREVEWDETPQVRFTSGDQADICILHPLGLTWQRNAPYPGWDGFFARVERDVRIAYEVTGPRKVERIGVRYVNRFDLPEGASHRDYITAGVEAHPSLGAAQTYIWRFENTFEGGLMAIVQSASVQPELPNTDAYVLDIDIVARTDLPIKLDEILEKVVSMRKLKNEIFEVLITDLAREVFNAA